MESRRIYCVVPLELAGRLHETLREHFLEDPSVEVVVERRHRDRRAGTERRGTEPHSAERSDERRKVRGTGGRRAGERRAALIPLPAEEIPDLPRRTRRFAGRLTFVERMAPSEQAAEDTDTARLVARIQAGEPQLFTELYMRYFDRVYRYLRISLRDRDEAEDLTQQVFTQVLEALPRYKPGASPFRGWLFRIVRNAAVSHLRKHGRTEATDPDELAQRLEQPADALPLSVLNWISDPDLVVLVERLPDPQRQILALRFFLDLRVTEVAAVLGRTPNDVSQLQHRALAFLEQRLRALGRIPQPGRRIRTRRRVHQAPVLRSRRFALLP